MSEPRDPLDGEPWPPGEQESYFVGFLGSSRASGSNAPGGPPRGHGGTARLQQRTAAEASVDPVPPALSW
jgi:hypothetical protein